MTAEKNVYVQISGRPATGKSTVMDLIEKALKDAGFQVVCDPRLIEVDDGEVIQEYTEERLQKFREGSLKRIDGLRPNLKIHITQRQSKRGEAHVGRKDDHHRSGQEGQGKD